MRVPSGSVTNYLPFIAFDSSDHTSRKTGLSSFTVYRDRNAIGAGTAVLYTTPTVVEADATHMPGVYWLLLDEDTTITSGKDEEACVVHITKTGMDPVTLSFELFRPKITVGQELSVAGGIADVDVQQWTGDVPVALDVNGYLQVNAMYVDGLAPASTDDMADGFLDRANGVDTGVTPRQHFRLESAVQYGKASGLDSSPIKFRGVNDDKDRVTVTQTASARSSVTLDAT